MIRSMALGPPCQHGLVDLMPGRLISARRDAAADLKRIGGVELMGIALSLRPAD